MNGGPGVTRFGEVSKKLVQRTTHHIHQATHKMEQITWHYKFEMYTLKALPYLGFGQLALRNDNPSGSPWKWKKYPQTKLVSPIVQYLPVLALHPRWNYT
jgi:hypothetical protein